MTYEIGTVLRTRRDGQVVIVCPPDPTSIITDPTTVWGYWYGSWKNCDGWHMGPLWTTDDDVELHPEPDKWRASFAYYVMTGQSVVADCEPTEGDDVCSRL